MRHDTHANRVRYGVPVFFTFSPDERHNVLMLRLSRTRRNDPVNEADACSSQFGGRSAPPVDHDFEEDVILGIPVEDLVSQLPP